MLYHHEHDPLGMGSRSRLFDRSLTEMTPCIMTAVHPATEIMAFPQNLATFVYFFDTQLATRQGAFGRLSETLTNSEDPTATGSDTREHPVDDASSRDPLVTLSSEPARKAVATSSECKGASDSCVSLSWHK